MLSLWILYIYFITLLLYLQKNNFMKICLCLPIASGITLSGYKSVRNKLLTKVDFPRPDSPTTISVNSKPFFTDFRCT